MQTSYTIRPFRSEDAPQLCEIFYRSVREVASAQYDDAQVRAWAPAVPDAEGWLPRLLDFDTLVADGPAGEPVAWIAMTRAGYIDMIFRLPEAAGHGVGTQLYVAIEAIARARGLTRLTAHASLVAQPFFAKHGWVVEYHETVERGGVLLPRAAMAKVL